MTETRYEDTDNQPPNRDDYPQVDRPIRDRLAYWRFKTTDAALRAIKWFTNPGVRYGQGCCTCGGHLSEWVYWGACAESRYPEHPDWEQCQACHEDPANAWFQTLRHTTITNYVDWLKGRTKDVAE